MQIAAAKQMQKMDKMAIETMGIPSTLLMERAAKGLVDAAMEHARQNDRSRAAIFCGSGNNGGDGVAAAYLLRRAGWDVRAFLVESREKMTEDCAEMERRLTEAGGVLEDFLEESKEQQTWCRTADVILDALFGIGLNREIGGKARAAIAWINACEGVVIAADIASGIEADTGRVLGCAVEADITVTFTCPKAGHMVGKGAIYTGELRIHDIGIPECAKEENLKTQVPFAEYLVAEEVTQALPNRPRDGHKGTFGKVYVLGGSVGLTGAPIFATKAAVRTGSGLVFAGVPRHIYSIIAVKSEEAMPYPLPCDEEGRLTMEAYRAASSRLEQCDAGLVGPGMGRSLELETLVCRLLYKSEKPMVIDADGLYAIRKQKRILKERAGKGRVTILTPHDGEFAYLGGMPADLSEQDRLSAAKRFAAEYGCILVLKGHRTIVSSPDGRTYVNTTGNSGMAKGGSGDVLGGMILSLLGQGMEPVLAAACAVWMHGRAGDICAEEVSEYAMRPMDLIECLPRVFGEL